MNKNNQFSKKQIQEDNIIEKQDYEVSDIELVDTDIQDKKSKRFITRVKDFFTEMHSTREIVPNKANLLEKLDNDQDLMVLEDLDSGYEFFLRQLDSFELNNKKYVCMASYEPDLGHHTEPELVIMTSKTGKYGEFLFESIRDKKELEEVFEYFYTRIERLI